MYLVVELPDANPEEVAPMVQFVGSELDAGQVAGKTEHMRWALLSDEESEGVTPWPVKKEEE